MRRDIVPGATFPDFRLKDQDGVLRSLSEIQESDPMIVVLARGGYCPSERQQHEQMVELYREMEVGCCRIVTISTDALLETYEFRSALGAHWPFLSDPERVVQKDLDIAEYTDPKHDPMIPHTIVLEPKLCIHEIYMGYWFFGRPTMEELRMDLREITRSCRPDWDITDPALKTAWKRGEKQRFYPYRVRPRDLVPTTRMHLAERAH